MKTHKLLILALPCLALFSFTSTSHAADTAIGAVARFHRQHTSFDELPLGDGDIGYGGTVEIHDGKAYWQCTVIYTEPKTNSVDYMVSPQVNMIFTDRYWLGGVGVMSSYLKSGEDEGDWLDVSWQFLLGLRFPVGPLNVEATAYYMFEKWEEIDKFEFDELEYAVSLTYTF